MPEHAPGIGRLVGWVKRNKTVWGAPETKTLFAAPNAAPTVGHTNDPTPALTPTYGFRRALTPPANAAAPSPDSPRRRDTARAAPCNVSGPCVQSTPTSPSTLFARRL